MLQADRRWYLIMATCGALLFLLLATILPFTSTRVFASPDETAVAAFARVWTWDGGFRVSTGLPEPIWAWSVSAPESIATIAGLHPRSMVQQGMYLVPVGFLGMPLLILPFEQMWLGSGSFLTALLVLSSAWALHRLVEPMGRKTAWTSVIVYLSFPVLLLYVNRALFPNLPVVALGVWAIYLLRNLKTMWSAIIGGIAFGLALMIRPVEALWLAPWMVWAIADRKRLRRAAVAGVTTLVVCFIGYFSAAKTYGTWFPTIGYWLREIVPDPVPSTIDPIVPNWVIHKVGTDAVLPFGIHPRAMWSNIEVYLFGIMGPWVAAALAGVALWFGGQRKWFDGQIMPIFLTGWTLFVLLLMYGQSRYADNINQTATLGNSFLRYLLPLVPLIAIGIGMLVEALWKMEDRRWKVFATGLVIFFAVYGSVVALVRDEESIIPVQNELMRYERIRATAAGMLKPGTIVLSERSDKIFVGLPVVAVSPMPNEETLRRITESGEPVALFHRILTPEQKETFAGGIFKDWLLASIFENEAIYIPPTQ